MDNLSQELSIHTFPTRVDSTLRKLVIQNLRSDINQTSEVNLENEFNLSGDEISFFKSLGVNVGDDGVFHVKRSYIFYIPPFNMEEMSITDISEYVKKVYENAKETYLQDKDPRYFYYDGNYPSREVYSAVMSQLSSFKEGLVEMFVPRFDISIEKRNLAQYENIIKVATEYGYTPIDGTDLLNQLNADLSTYQDYLVTMAKLDDSIKELVKDVKKPLLYFYTSMNMHLERLSTTLALYAYQYHSIVTYVEENFSQHPIKLKFQDELFSTFNNSLHNVLMNIKGLPDITFYRRGTNPSGYLAMLFKEKLSIVARIKYIKVNADYFSDVLQIEEIDLAKVDLINILSYYQITGSLSEFKGNYDIMREGLLTLQSFLSEDEFINFRNCILFAYDDSLCLGYVSNYTVTQPALLLPLEEDLPAIEVELNKGLISSLLPLDWVLNFKDIATSVRSIFEVYKHRYKQSKPSLKFTMSGESKYMFLTNSTANFSYDSILNLEGWSRYSPLAIERRLQCFPVIDRYLYPSVIFKQGNALDYFLSSIERSPQVVITTEMVKGGNFYV